jgi:Flp pilus assembly protein TadG
MSVSGTMQSLPKNSGATVTARLRGRRQRGSTIVEQALVLPIMLAVLFGAIDMSRALYTYHYVSYIAREATRWASVRSKNSFNGGVTPTQLQTYVSDVSGMGLDKNQITSSLSYIAPSNPTPLCPGGTTDSVLNNKPGCVVQVTVNYNYTFFMPFLPKGAFTMSSESQMVITQ